MYEYEFEFWRQIKYGLWWFKEIFGEFAEVYERVDYFEK